MAVVLVVETGEGLANSNSYLSLAEATLMAGNLQIELPAVEDDLKAKIIKACVYLETKACKYQGKIKSLEQALSWPRTGVNFQGIALPDTAIPKNLKLAQFSVLNAILQGFEPNQNINVSELVIEDKVDVLTTKFANPVDYGGITTILSEADQFLKPLYFYCGGLGLRSYRA